MNKFGQVIIADEVIATIAGVAASEIAGVVGFKGNLITSINEMVGKKVFSKGIKIQNSTDIINIEVEIIIDYGFKIPEVAAEVQEAVKTQVEAMTGLTVESTTIKICGIKTKQGEILQTNIDEE